MEEIVVKRLMEKGWFISFAESCTAGLCAARLVNVADASKVFKVSFTTYWDSAKVEYLGVKQETIDTYNVVSEDVAYEMAQGVATRNDCQVGVGVTGVAGPTGGSREIPVGTVCFGFYINGTVITDTVHFGDLGRNRVRKEACDYVYRRLTELL